MSVQNKVKTYSWLAVISMIVNYAVGTGILNLPHTLAAASIGVSAIFLAFLSFLSYLLGQYSLELDSMSFALIRAGKIEAPDMELIDEEVIQESTEKLLDPNQQVTTSSISQTPTPDYSIPNNVVYQVSSQCRFYGGKPGFYAYQVCITIYFFGTLWGYGSVVAQSLTSVIPMYALPNHVKGTPWVCSDPCKNYMQSCSDSYWIWICITMVFASILIFFDLGEQKVVQAIFTTCRFLELGLTAILIIYCLATQPFLPASEYKDGTFVNPQTKYFAWDTAAFGSLVSSLTFTQIYHHSLPSIFQFTRHSSQRKIPLAIMISNIFLALITLILAMPGALYFGGKGANLVVINFNSWTGSDFSGGKQPGFVAFLSYLVRLLPPIYVLGGIPINALTMSLNIQEMIPLEKRKKLWVKIIVNLCCIIPAMIVAGFARCLGIIIDFSGLLGYFLMIAPALCCIKAQRMCKTTFGSSKENRCTFSFCLSQQWLMWVIVVVNSISFVLTTYSLIAGLVK